VSPEKQIDKNLLKKLQKFKGGSKLKVAALNILVKTLTPKDIEPLRLKFMALDKDQSGFILPSELAEALQNSEVQMSGEEISEMIREIDHHQNGKINYSEFLQATVNVGAFMTEEKMWMIFKRFDIDDSGAITKENL